jgi:cytochrome subunit of sulfide dehydrogenase
MIARAAAAACLGVACIALAQQPAPPPAFAPANLSPAGVRAMAANCAPCHGTEGRAAPGSTVPGLAGRAPGEIVEAMTLFREGKKPATVMHQIAKGFVEPEVAALDEYFSRQKAR